MQGSYIYYLVIISYIVASFGSFTGLTLATRISTATTPRQKNLLHFGAAFVLGSSIWSMHFIGMLAYKMNMPVTYDMLLTAISFLIAFFSAYAMFKVIRFDNLKPVHIVISAILLGFAISGMHYSGMAAMEMKGELRYIPSLFLLSILIAIAASGAAIWIMFDLTRKKRKHIAVWHTIAALTMGAAICGMHYTGMEAAVFISNGKLCALPAISPTGNLDSENLALIIAAFTCSILGIALILVLHKKQQENTVLSYKTTTFPLKLLGIAFIITKLSVLGIGVYSYNAFQSMINDPHMLEVSQNIYYALYVAMVVAVLLAVAWYFAMQNLRTWQQEAIQSRSNLAQRLIEREEIHADMIQQKTFLDTLLHNMPLAIIAKNAKDNYRFVMINKTAEKLLYLKEDEMLNRTDYAFFPKEEADFFRKTDEAVMANGKVVEIEAERVTTQRGSFTAHTLKVPIYDAAGKPSLLLIILEDVTEKIKARDELRLAKELAEQANQAKSEFLANMSHELRTPLNSIIGMTQLISEKDVKPDIKDIFDIVRTSSEFLLATVNDILDLSKIEAREVTLERIPFDIHDATHRVIQSLLPIASKKGLQLTYHLDFDTLHVTGDPLRFSRILINLINNAIRYTNKGSVTVNASITPQPENMISLHVDIIDTGIGIAPEQQKTIFEKFSQADTSTTRRYGGTGLGLTITKELIELMGGRIGLDSKVGEGTAFWFDLPFEQAENVYGPLQVPIKTPDYPDIAMVSDKIPAKSVQILVAEDHSMNQTLMKRVFKNFGITHYKIVETGQEAIEEVRNAPYDVVLMDCHMPEMNGYDATVAIRKLSDTHKSMIPIIAMTANAMPQDRQKCLEIGMNAYLSKPINVSAFKDMLSQWIDFG